MQVEEKCGLIIPPAVVSPTWAPTMPADSALALRVSVSSLIARMDVSEFPKLAAELGAGRYFCGFPELLSLY